MPNWDPGGVHTRHRDCVWIFFLPVTFLTIVRCLFSLPSSNWDMTSNWRNIIGCRPTLLLSRGLKECSRKIVHTFCVCVRERGIKKEVVWYPVVISFSPAKVMRALVILHLTVSGFETLPVPPPAPPTPGFPCSTPRSSAWRWNRLCRLAIPQNT